VTAPLLAVPCRTDEPALGSTLSHAQASWECAYPGEPLEVWVCLNGTAEGAAAVGDLERFARDVGRPLVRVDCDTCEEVPPPGDRPNVVALLTRRAGKAMAWNQLRARARAEVLLFVDADVAFAPETFGRLLSTLAAHPGAAIASPRTVCAPRPTAFERIMAAPYGVTFPNLSPQLYAARRLALPPAMPDDLIEPERWLELAVGAGRIVRAPGAEVAVRLPATLADFFRQRVRIEMGKVQIAHEYPGLAARGARQPGARAALGRLGAVDLGRLGAYLALRASARAVAEWRYRGGRLVGIWRQAASTKQWGRA